MFGAIPPLPQYVSLAWYLVRHNDNFTFILSRWQHRLFGCSPVSLSLPPPPFSYLWWKKLFHSLGRISVGDDDIGRT
jgi:hypothetical protein